MITNDSLDFRPDIEGLRAVAILLVVAAHANTSGFSGGFIGVDVFFVLSGYLITGLLVQDQELFGHIRIGYFYTRRIRRLIPSLLVVLVCTSLLAQQLLPSGEQSEQAIAAATAAVWLSNFHFLVADLDYFGHGNQGNLFLHTWSLSVEEQFYLLWPALLITLCGFRASSQARIDFKRLKLVLLAILIVGFLSCVVWSSLNPMQAFYMMPSRAWQFALGAIVFVYLNRNQGKSYGSQVFLWLGWLGLLAILSAAVLLDAETHYPGLWALLPSLGAAAILASGVQFPNHGVGKILSLPLMTGLGRVSYVWYLWHWPILLLGAEVFDVEQPIVRAGLVGLSLVLAVLTHVLVESPFRQNKRLQPSVRFTLTLAGCAMFAVSALAVNWGEETQYQVQMAYAQSYEKARWDAPSIYSKGCDDWHESDEIRVCEFGLHDAEKTVVAIGDSIGLQWFSAIEAAFDATKWRILVLTKSSCPMVDQPIFYQRIKSIYDVCERWRNSALAFVAQIKPDIVIMGSSYTYSYTEEQWRSGTSRVLQSIAPHSQQIYILRATPLLPFNAPSCLATRGWLFHQLVNDDRCSAPHNDDRQLQVHQWVSAAAQEFNNVDVIDMTEEICPGKVCFARRNGLFIYRDSQHLTASFAKSLGEAFAGRIGYHLLD